jgi:hypothetical protein
MDTTITVDLDIKAFCTTRPGLWVDPHLEHYVELETSASSDTEPLKYCDLEHNIREGQYFSDKDFVDLEQVARLIDEQWGGRSGQLLSNGKANIFLLKGKQQERRLLAVDWFEDHRREWRMHCHPFIPGFFLKAGWRAFKN